MAAFGPLLLVKHSDGLLGSGFWTRLAKTLATSSGQLGVAVPAGVEVAIHTVRSYFQRHASAGDRVVVRLDFENAFNSISRTAVLAAAATHFPHLARWATWCYQEASMLQFGDSVLESAGGVQQGDFTWAPAVCLRYPISGTGAARQRPRPLLLFLDDGVIAGTPAVVGQALAHVEARAAAIGLRLNLAKSVAVLVGAAAEESLRGHLPQQLLVDAAGASRVSRNLELLGAAIGDNAFVEQHTQARADNCWTPSRSLTTRKWACAFCAPALAMRASSTASDVLLRGPNLLLCSTSTNKCRPALLASPGST